jgi:signal transduction histidine kinase/HAMP domain-containing protein
MAVRIRGSIGTTIFGAFVAMSVITGTLGALGIYILSLAGDFVAHTYDGPLMAVNYARSASLDFAQMDKELLHRDLVPESERAAIDRRLTQLTTTFFEDLAIADERSQSDDVHVVIAEIGRLVTQWDELRRRGGGGTISEQLNRLSEQVIQRFDLLTELTVGHTFVTRRKAVSAMSDFRTISITAIALALLLSAGITLLLARRIVAPLSAAAAVADRIAGGEFETPIPSGGGDETGKLLRSMAVMQNNVRVMMEREKAGRQSAQDRLIAALESSPDAMVLVDASGRVVTANSQLTVFFPPLARQISGADNFAAVFKEVASRLVTRIVVPNDARSEVDWSDLLAVGGEFQLADGRWLRASRSSTPDGGFFLVLSDFSEIKEREERLKEAKLQAEAASAAKSNFLANMSHELRTPLNAIIGFADIISRQVLGGGDNPRYRDYATDIVRSGQHLLEVITSVLDVAKSEAGKLQLNAETVDLRHIFDDCIAMMREQCERARLHLVVERPSEPLLAWAEPAKLRQIILNLLSNAVKFTDPGGTVSLVASPPFSGVITVRVADTGIGMSPEHIAIALTPFSQVDNRLARRYEGTGLGLPLTKALVELHRGEMTIVSKLGVGTEVTFSLRDSSAGRDTGPQLTSGATAKTG